MKAFLLCISIFELLACSERPNPADDAQLPSCAGIELTCGASGDSCCSAFAVTSGHFLRDNSPEFPAFASEFKLDEYEVSVGRFRRFVAAYDSWRALGHPRAGEGTSVHTANERWEGVFDTELPPSGTALTTVLQSSACIPHEVTWTDAPNGAEDLPMNCVTWYEAYAFCIWDGARLPTEAEWAYAATGGDEQRKYPWGNAEPGDNADLAVYGCWYAGGQRCSHEDIAPLGQVPLGRGRFGQLDLAGSMREWVFDRYQEPYPDTECTDCANASLGENRSFRGGSWYNSAVSLSTSIRNNNLPTFRSDSIGFRCARDR